MRKKMWVIVGVILLAAAWCMSAYAAEGQVTAWRGFWNSIGGFIYNTLPWNWHNWLGK